MVFLLPSVIQPLPEDDQTPLSATQSPRTWEQKFFASATELRITVHSPSPAEGPTPRPLELTILLSVIIFNFLSG